MNTNKPMGYDGIPVKFYKRFSEQITPHFTKVINSILENGEYPNSLKTALITPLYKQKGEKSNVRNYRPISVLSTSTKIIEKLISDKLTSRLEKHSIIMTQQHGYRRNRSTQSAILVLTDNIKYSSDNGRMTGAVFVDFEAAFDNIQHNVLLQKMFNYGIRGKVLQVFKSYFSNRHLIVQKGNERSQPFNMIQGTPQGSSLSSEIFSLYINDIPNYFEECQSIFYCDDLVLYTSGESMQEIQNKLQYDLNKLQDWCNLNCMKVNVAKTKCMLLRNTKKINENLKLCISNNEIENVKVFKYLGLELNESLVFENHYIQVCKTMNNRIFLLNRYKHLFTFKWRHIFITSLILSILDYCLPVWGDVPEYKAKRINRILLRAAKLVLLKNAFVTTKLDAFDKLNWLLFSERVEIYSLCFIFKHVKQKSTLNDCFQNFEKRQSNRASKLEHDFLVKKMKTNFGQSAFFYRGTLMWNKLPSGIKKSCTFHDFNVQLRLNTINQRTLDSCYF